MADTSGVTRIPFPAAHRAGVDTSALLSADPHSPSTDDLAMIDFLRRWHVYGGGRADDIMVGFGLAPSEYFRRVRMLLEAGIHETDRTAIDAMLAVCRKRLWLGQ